METSKTDLHITSSDFININLLAQGNASHPLFKTIKENSPAHKSDATHCVLTPQQIEEALDYPFSALNPQIQAYFRYWNTLKMLWQTENKYHICLMRLNKTQARLLSIKKNLSQAANKTQPEAKQSSSSPKKSINTAVLDKMLVKLQHHRQVLYKEILRLQKQKERNKDAYLQLETLHSKQNQAWHTLHTQFSQIIAEVLASKMKKPLTENEKATLSYRETLLSLQKRYTELGLQKEFDMPKIQRKCKKNPTYLLVILSYLALREANYREKIAQ